ncbi:unnamed protein product [Chrysoparadoxa australica]
MLGVDLLMTADRIKCMSDRPKGFVKRYQEKMKSLGRECPFLLVITFVLPWGSFIAYFAARHGGSSPSTGDAMYDAFLNKFLTGDDEFRNSRLKIIPRCVEGPWVVKQAVKGRPAVIGTKMAVNYHVRPGSFEIEADVCASATARGILSCVKSNTGLVDLCLMKI